MGSDRDKMGNRDRRQFDRYGSADDDVCDGGSGRRHDGDAE